MLNQPVWLMTYGSRRRVLRGCFYPMSEVRPEPIVTNGVIDSPYKYHDITPVIVIHNNQWPLRNLPTSPSWHPGALRAASAQSQACAAHCPDAIVGLIVNPPLGLEKKAPPFGQFGTTDGEGNCKSIIFHNTRKGYQSMQMYGNFEEFAQTYCMDWVD